MLAYRKTTVYKLGQYKSLATLQLFSTFNSFLAGLGRNQVYGASCSAQTTHDQFKPVQKSRKQVLRAYCPNLYTVRKTNNAQCMVSLAKHQCPLRLIVQNFTLTLIGMSYESKKNAHFQRHLGASFKGLNELGRMSNYPD